MAEERPTELSPLVSRNLNFFVLILLSKAIAEGTRVCECSGFRCRGPGIWNNYKQAMIPLHGMAENRPTSVYFFTNVFLGEIFFLPPKFLVFFLFSGLLDSRCI